jgi:hypothetical protein
MVIERFKLPADFFDHLDYKGRRSTTILEIMQLLAESERTELGSSIATGAPDSGKPIAHN